MFTAPKLLELPTDAIEAIQDGRITPAHGHQILRAPVETQGAITHHVLEARRRGPIRRGNQEPYRP